MSSNDIQNLGLNQIIDKNHSELREGKKIPLAEELEKKNLGKSDINKEESEKSTLVSKEEDKEPKIVNSEKIILSPSLIDGSPEDSIQMIQKEKYIPNAQNGLSFKELQNKDTKSEIPNTFLNKKTKRLETPIDVNKSLDIDIIEGYDFNFNVYNKILEEKEKDEEKYFDYFGDENEYEDFESQYKDKDPENSTKNKENVLNSCKEFKLEKNNNMKDDADYDDGDIFDCEKFNKDILCNKNNYNNGITADGDNFGESINVNTYVLAPIEGNTSTYYKTYKSKT